MKNPILKKLSILHECVDGWLGSIEVSMELFDDGKKYTATEAKEIFEQKIDWIIKSLEKLKK